MSLTRPRIKRSGHKLVCRPGHWANAPSTFAYRWRTGKGERGRALALTRRLRGHKIRCAVTASNAAGTATAVSRPFRA